MNLKNLVSNAIIVTIMFAFTGLAYGQSNGGATTQKNKLSTSNSLLRYIDDGTEINNAEGIIVVTAPQAVNAKNLFAGGTGTELDPFQIETADHLNNVRLYLGSSNADVYFLQTANINLGIAPWNEGEGWLPIGNTSSNFFGKYNGSDFTISGLTINRPVSHYIGLFGCANNARLSNIGLVNVDITGAQRVGALAGQLRNAGYIGNCYSTGIVKGQTFPAGLVGNLYYTNSTIENSYSSVNVEFISGEYVKQQAGGLVGRVLSGKVLNCYATGNVSGNGTWLGGLVGLATGASEISNSYSTGNVSGAATVGGFIGGIEYSSLTSCYSVGKVSFSESGGGFSWGNVDASATNCYWNTETSGQANSTLGEPKTTLEMINQSTYPDWSFESIWSINSGSTYPYLQWQGTAGAFNYPPSLIPPTGLVATPSNGSISLAWNTPSIGTVTGYIVYRDGVSVQTVFTNAYNDEGLTNYTTYTYFVTALYDVLESEPTSSVSTFPNTGFALGDGTELNPYLVSNANELYTTRLFLSSFFRQVADIDLGVAPWNTDEGWNPIGQSGNPFTGSYNGNGFNINNLTINRPTQSTIGLFGQVGGGVFENINLLNANVNGLDYVGSLVGDVWDTSIANISTNANISGLSYVGGIVGWARNIQISNTHTSGSINSTGNWTGGIAGINYMYSKINNCYSSMIVTSMGANSGGVSGINDQESEISNSYFTGTITGNNYVGGIVGQNGSSILNSCYSIGSVNGNSNLGGLAGTSTGQVINSYWNTETSGIAISAGGEGRTTEQMIYPYDQNTYLDWGFSNIWADDENATENNGYPYLRMGDESIEIKRPTANQVLVSGNSDVIAWASTGAENVSISYSINNGVEWTLIESDVPSMNGVNYYNWFIPIEIEGTYYECLIQIEDVNLEIEAVSSIFQINSGTTYTVTFNITDEDEMPITDAIITFDGIVNSANVYEFTNINSGDYDYIVTKEGFNPISGTVSVLDMDQTVYIELIHVGVNPNPLASLRVYPNPFSNYISTSNPNLVKRVVIDNIVGQKIIDIELNGEAIIETTKLLKGVYIITFEASNGDCIVHKMVKK